jgi:iron complex transport system ATP-binding protein
MTADRIHGIRVSGVTISVPGRKLIDALDFEAGSGEFVAVLGPNGVGKSLALHTLAGLRPAATGTIKSGDRDLTSLSRHDIARGIGLLPQYTEDFFPATALDTVLIGRHPHIPPLQWESDDDLQIALDALRQVGLGDFAGRDVLTLSGGERRRVAIAQILTQAPQVYLLDEPTNHLDPQHQLEVPRLFRERSSSGNTVIASLHDVNMAARFADRCVLLFGDGRWQTGPVDEVLEPGRLAELYATPIEAVSWGNNRLFVATG